VFAEREFRAWPIGWTGPVKIIESTWFQADRHQIKDFLAATEV
jgi:hypothetical protein